MLYYHQNSQNPVPAPNQAILSLPGHFPIFSTKSTSSLFLGSHQVCTGQLAKDIQCGQETLHL